MNDQNIPVAAHITILKPQNPTPQTFILPRELVLTRKMYYDKQDKEHGDGFYPQLARRMNSSYGSDNTRNDSVNIRFRWSETYPDVWTQIDNSVIYGFDGKYGKELLHSLNEESCLNAARISNSGGRIIHPNTIMNSTYRIMNKNMSESNRSDIFKLLRLSATDRFRVNAEDAIRRRSQSFGASRSVSEGELLNSFDVRRISKEFACDTTPSVSALQNNAYVIIDNT